MKIFYDGLDVQKYSTHPSITGFTTNCTFFSVNNIKNYSEFYANAKDFVKEKCISFQVWEENEESGIEQVNNIHRIDSSIFIKIPIIKSTGEYNETILKHAILNNMSVNITAIYTIEQIDKAFEYLKDTTLPQIVSIFAGPISDSGKDPDTFIKYAKTIFKEKNNVQVLWAGCRELYSIKRAENAGADIITVPGDIIDKMNLFDYELIDLSIERVSKFKNNAIDGNVTIC